MFVRIENLTTNENKTKYLHVNRRVGRDRIGQNITIDTYNFEYIREFQYMGVIITVENGISYDNRYDIRHFEYEIYL